MALGSKRASQTGRKSQVITHIGMRRLAKGWTLAEVQSANAKLRRMKLEELETILKEEE